MWPQNRRARGAAGPDDNAVGALRARDYHAPMSGPDALARLYAATASLARGSTDEREVLGQIARSAAELLRAPYAAVGIVDDHGDLREFVVHGLTDDEYARLKDHPPIGRGILGALLREGRPLRLDDLTRDPLAAGFPIHHPPMRAFLGLPLHLDGRVIGRLYATHARAGVFDEDDERLAMGFAAAASVAIGNARLATSLRAQTDAAVLASSQLWAVLDALEQGVIVTDPAGTIVVVGDRIAGLVGASSPLAGQNEEVLATLLAAPDVLLSAIALERAQPRITDSDELTLQAFDRTLRRYSAPVLAVDDTLLGRVSVYADVSRERIIQEQIVSVERLRATGEMASGLAHDFNNVLATILGRVELLLGQVTDATLIENLAAVQRAARDGAATVARMREYGRPLDQATFQPFALATVIAEAIEFTRPRWREQAVREGRTIEIETHLTPTRPALGEAPAFRDVLVNLIFNAVDAMPHGGTIAIGLAPAGGGAELTIRDTGMGMTPALQRRIFEPFFTTKGERGSGLGLAMVRKVIASLGGHIDVTSAPGDGTTFTIWLPATDRPAPTTAAQSTADQRPRRLGRIVLIDDQTDVRDTEAMLLRAEGHDLRAFSDPAVALGAIDEDPPDLVITDLGMPGLTGWDVARALQARHPALPVIFLTGWGRELTAAQLREGGVSGVIPKPMDLSEARRAIDAALPHGDQPLRVLIADDSAAFAAVLALLFRQAGHHARTAATADAALGILATDRHDLIVLDANLPAALDLARKPHAGAPLLCVASGSPEGEMTDLVPGAALYVEKVRVPERLDEIVRRTREREVAAHV
ncbi:MAG: response regulator [Chloroflexi bacterium]|nr:response regulator [Chloroflexota bacterium]